VSLRYGATGYAVYRYRDDLYKFLQMAEFESKDGWEDYWYGPEFVEFRTLTSSWYQVPVLYGWTDLVVSGALEPEPVAPRSVVTRSGDEVGDSL
jgi:hypothetical protein